MEKLILKVKFIRARIAFKTRTRVILHLQGSVIQYYTYIIYYLINEIAFTQKMYLETSIY